MVLVEVSLDKIAYARSGDKGASANIGVIAYTSQGFEFLKEYLSANKVANYFKGLHPLSVKRYELNNLLALNFVLDGVLEGGGSRSLRIDAQGKVLGQALLLMQVQIHEEQLLLCTINK